MQTQMHEHARRLEAAAHRAKVTGTSPTLADLGLGDVVLPSTVLQAAAAVLRKQASGHEPTVVVVRELMSAQQAADMLGVSRPHLTMLLDRDRIPYEKTTGGHRRICRQDIEEYRTRQELARSAMHDAMKSAEQLADDDR